MATTRKPALIVTCPLCGHPHFVSLESLKRDVSLDTWRPATLGESLYNTWKARKGAKALEDAHRGGTR